MATRSTSLRNLLAAQNKANNAFREVESVRYSGKSNITARQLGTNNITRRLAQRRKNRTMRNVRANITPGKVKRMVASSSPGSRTSSNPRVQELQQRMNDIGFILAKKNLGPNVRSSYKRELLDLEADLSALI